MSLCINPYCSKTQNTTSTLFCTACGSELLLQGRYRVMHKLGEGGFGKTYEVSDVQSNSPKVLKILINPHTKAVELFQREAEVLALLNHPGIPKVEANGYFIYYPKNSQEPLHCLVMEKIEGLDLDEYLQQRDRRPIDEKLAINWLIEITGILQQVHSQNFFHRDIKPSNIMLRTDGRLALIDFGTARQVTGSYMAKQVQGQVTGIVSVGYTPFEQMNGQAVRQSDFFALGRTFVYLLTGKEPNELYNPNTDELLWRDSTSGLSPQFMSFLDCMMARLPSQRPQTAEEIVQTLNNIENFLPPSASKVPPTFIETGSGAPPTFVDPASRWSNSFATPEQRSQSGIIYAGVWRRFIATIFDWIFLHLTFFIPYIVVGSLLFGESPTEQAAADAYNQTIALVYFGTILIYACFYRAVFEFSDLRGTLGKAVMGIIVVDRDFKKLSFGRALLRNFSRFASYLTFGIGFFYAMANPQKQSLHDAIAKSVVVTKKSFNRALRGQELQY